MAKKKSEQLTLEELRDKSAKAKTKLSFGKEMGGYNKKQVTEYIDNLTENLSNAEESFNNRLEEYAAMITMLKQERDQYGEMYNLCKSSKIEMVNQIEELKRENEGLSQLVKELPVNQNPLQAESYHPDSQLTSVEAQKKLEEYLTYEQESAEMKAQLDQLKTMVRDLNTELETYAKENRTDSAVESIENGKEHEAYQVLKNQYEDILRERRALLTEKNRLAAENNKLTATVADLKTANQNCDAAIQALNSNIDEFIKNHQENLVQLLSNVNNSVNLVKIEEEKLINFTRLMRSESNWEQ